MTGGQVGITLSPGSDRTAKQGADPFSERRIAILLPDLRSGGAEQLHINLANEWIRRGFQVEFVLQQAKGELLVQLPEGATVIDATGRALCKRSSCSATREKAVQLM